MKQFVVIGGGPAGLTGAYCLAKSGFVPTVLEKSAIVGGLSRTEVYKGYHFDMGGHRFYTKSAQVRAMWQEVLGDDFLTRPRLSRIYYRGRFFDYPLKPLNAVTGLGVAEGIRILLSYLRWQALPHRVESTFEEWVTNRFGKRLFSLFFKSYTEKVWGIPCSELRAEWAEQRIKQLSLATAVAHMFYRPKEAVRSLISQFHYPCLGPGMLWNRVRELIEQRGGTVLLNADVVSIQRDGYRITSVHARHDGRECEFPGTDFLSSMPVAELIKRLDPPAPAALLDAARRLQYRDFLVVCLIINRKHIFSDNWIYIHDPAVGVARIQNFKNWSPHMVPDASKTSLGMEYFCQRGDKVWNSADSDLIRRASSELEQIGLGDARDIEDGCVFRVPYAYPVYDSQYAQFLELIKKFLGRFENIQSIGRNGLHRYNNQDHAMLTGMAAARNATQGASVDLWSINADQEYLEEVKPSEVRAQCATPQAIERARSVCK